MKTRIIKTKIWQDSTFKKLSFEARFVFIYLLSCPYVSLTSYFEISFGQIKEDTGLSDIQIKKAVDNLEEKGRAFFYDGWVFIPNLDKHNPYWKSPKTEKAYKEELSSIPNNILDYFKKKSDSTINSTIHSTPKTENINNKSKIINNNRDREIIREKEKEKEIKEKEKEIIDFFNQQHNTKYKTIGVSENNLKFWLEKYSIDEIKQAIILIKAHDFWAGKMTPTILFRTKGQSGQPVDYIGQLLNQPKPTMKPNEQYGEYTKRLEIWRKYGKSQ